MLVIVAIIMLNLIHHCRENLKGVKHTHAKWNECTKIQHLLEYIYVDPRNIIERTPFKYIYPVDEQESSKS